MNFLAGPRRFRVALNPMTIVTIYEGLLSEVVRHQCGRGWEGSVKSHEGVKAENFAEKFGGKQLK